MYGQKCALIEAKALGGTCVNVGCVPKKWCGMLRKLPANSSIRSWLWFDTTVNRFDWDTLISSRTAYIDRIHQSYERVLGNNKVDVIQQGFARFVDAHTIEVTVKNYRR